MDWLKKNNIAEYNSLMELRKQWELTNRFKDRDETFENLKKAMKDEGEKHIGDLQKKLSSHQKSMKMDMNYVM
jgi:hypothetical protein